MQHPENRKQLSFDLRDGGYDVRDHQIGDKAPIRYWHGKGRLAPSAIHGRAAKGLGRSSGKGTAASRQLPLATGQTALGSTGGSQEPGVVTQESDADKAAAQDPFGPAPVVQISIRPRKQHTGIVMGIALASVRDHEGNDHFMLLPGDDVTITVPTAGTHAKAEHELFTVVDFYESKMSEYDSTFVFVPIKELQEPCAASAPTSRRFKSSSSPASMPIWFAMNCGSSFPLEIYGVYTWRDKQGPLLAAVQMERAVLNILLFLIIAVAGFGILAIFFMIVVEKTRDIGILKSLGASSRGIMGIFLGYGLSLGMVGAGVGLAIGLLFVHYINQIRYGSGMDHRPGGLRSGDLLLLRNSDDRRSVDGRMDRVRRLIDRRAGQRPAGLPRRPTAPCGGTAL